MAKKKTTPTQDRSALQTCQSAEVGWLQLQFAEHPVLGLTPQKLHQLLSAAEQGNLQAQADLFCDFEERDGHIFSEMDKRKRGTTGLSWGIKPPRNASAGEKNLAAEVAEWVDEIRDFEVFLFNALDGIGHGYSCQEINWQQVGSLWLPASFDHQLPRNFQTPLNTPNELRLRDGSMDGAEFWDFGWFVHRHQAKSGYIARAGLHRVLSWPFLFKNYGTRDLAEFLHIYGLPLRLGKYSAGATDKEKMTLLRAVMGIGRNAGGIIPKGMDIDFQEAATGTADPHMAMIKWCEQTQSKIIVGGTLLSQADGKTSTNAQGRIHEEQFTKLVKSDSMQLARSINDHLIDYMMRLNYPHITPDRYPVFYFDVADIEDIGIYSEALPKLVDAGLPIPVSYVLKKLNIPEAQDGEAVLARTPKTSEKPSIAANTVTATQQQVKSGFRLAALTQQVKANLFNDQALLDQAIDELDAGDLQAQSRAMIDSILQQLESAQNPDEALGILANISPDASTELLQARLSRLLFAAEAWGAVNAWDELQHGN